MKDLLIELSQFVSDPARTGIQRALTELVSRWDDRAMDADVGFFLGRTYHVAPIARIREIIGTHFTRIPADRNSFVRELAAASSPSRKRSSLTKDYRAYLLPELTFQDRILDVLSDWCRTSTANVFALLFDALPQTSPQVFSQGSSLPTTRYFIQMAGLRNVASISSATRDCFETRMRRSAIPNSTVLWLGADLPRSAAATQLSPVPAFVAVGTIEPRKNHALILDAFEQLWSSGINWRLTFLGAAGGHDQDFLGRLSEAAKRFGDRFVWREAVTDDVLTATIANSWGALFVSELEGYGLPAVEALALGCPLVVSAGTPALAQLPEHGQVRLHEISSSGIAAAVQRLADPEVNRRLREDISQLQLPTWQEFVASLQGWIQRSLV